MNKLLYLLFCICSIILTGCIEKNLYSKLIVFKTKDNTASIALQDGFFYVNPYIENNKIFQNEIGKQIYINRQKKQKIICHSFGDFMVIANSRINEGKCLGWKFQKNYKNNFYEYLLYCDNKIKCVDEVFLERPYLQYFLNDKSELIKFRFDPTRSDSKVYFKTGSGKYAIE